MAHYELLIFVVVFCCLLVGFLLGVVLTYKRGVKDYEIGYQNGCEYVRSYINALDKDKYKLQKQREDEEKKRLDALNEANGITPDLLIAYGVGSVNELPKHVKQQYGVTEGNDDTVEDLIEKDRR